MYRSLQTLRGPSACLPLPCRATRVLWNALYQLMLYWETRMGLQAIPSKPKTISMPALWQFDLSHLHQIVRLLQLVPKLSLHSTQASLRPNRAKMARYRRTSPHSRPRDLRLSAGTLLIPRQADLVQDDLGCVIPRSHLPRLLSSLRPSRRTPLAIVQTTKVLQHLLMKLNDWTGQRGIHSSLLRPLPDVPSSTSEQSFPVEYC